MTDFNSLICADLMKAYKFSKIGKISAPDSKTFLIEITIEESKTWEKTVYIFVFNDEIVRIGSSKKALGKRMKAWSRDVTKALHKIHGIESKKTNTPEWEARAWAELLNSCGEGEIFARKATKVITPVGEFRAYMDEESILINRHKPRLNRHSNR